jgi:hypothetical protein
MNFIGVLLLAVVSRALLEGYGRPPRRCPAAAPTEPD